MKKISKYIFSAFLATATVLTLAALSSCSPVRYSIDLEKKIESEYDIDFGKGFPGVVTISEKGDKDSVILSQIALGIAERLERDMPLDTGTIPVYSIEKAFVDFSDSSTIEYLHKAVGTDILIIVDSFRLGDFDVQYKKEKAYYDDQFLNQIVVELPYHFGLKIYKEGEGVPLADIPVNDKIEWLIYSDNVLSDVKAIDNVRNKIEDSFKEAGGETVHYFMPHWIKDTKDLFVYDEDKWVDAYNFAYMFEWDKAMKIWLKEAKRSSSQKAACAAYNLSVACEVLGMHELSKEWKKRYDDFKKYMP